MMSLQEKVDKVSELSRRIEKQKDIISGINRDPSFEVPVIKALDIIQTDILPALVTCSDEGAFANIEARIAGVEDAVGRYRVGDA